jgi:hypothetical protein
MGEFEAGKIVGDRTAIAGYEWCPLCDEVHNMNDVIEPNPLMDDMPMGLTECEGCRRYFSYQSTKNMNDALTKWYHIFPSFWADDEYDADE